MEKTTFRRARTCAALLALCSFAALPGPADALDLSGLADMRFAEEYAFSTNRAALAATLRPRTKAWFAYSILAAQTDGRLDYASKLLREWEKLPKHSPERNAQLMRDFRDRQNFLCWKGAPDERLTAIKTALENAGIRANLPPRAAEVKPDTYPSALDGSAVSFAAFWEAAARNAGALEPRFRHIALRKEANTRGGAASEAAEDCHLPDEPGFLQAVVAYLKDGERAHVFKNRGAMAKLTLAQLETIARETRGCDKDVSNSAEFANAVLAKIAPGADDDPNDPATREAVLQQRFAFTETLAPGLARFKVSALRDLLEFYRSRGDMSHTDLFIRYLKETANALAQNRSAWKKRAIREDDFPGGDRGLVRDWLAAARTAGRGADVFPNLVEAGFLARVFAETDLLAGKPPESVDVSVFSDSEYKALGERVELAWAKSNPQTFAGNDKVSLAIDVKNVPRMRIAVYELDAAAACRQAGGEISSAIDLDCAVPTSERTVDFSEKGSMLRHREILELSALSRPGVYVVECSGAGMCSRALVRKGRLRATVRGDAAGYSVIAIGEDGAPAKDAVLWLDGTAFRADGNGEISVPFASSAKTAGEKTAIVAAGDLATAVKFTHAEETPALSISAVLPAESLVAGAEAAALIRARLSISGVPVPAGLLENPSLSIVFKDSSGRESVRTIAPFELKDDAESVCRFTVPKNMVQARFTLSGTIKRTADGKEIRLEAGAAVRANAIAQTDEIIQPFLRRTPRGCIIEFRGRTGERVPSRAAEFRFKHRAFRERSEPVTLQGDANGEIFLGPLQDIAQIEMKAYGTHRWNLEADWPAAVALPGSISAVEGETIEIPARWLSEGAWPGARELAARVSLLSVNAAGKTVAAFNSACSYENGMLRMAGLPAGDYTLAFRAEGASVQVRVARAAAHKASNGFICGKNRRLPDTGSPRRLAVKSAERGKDGVLRIALANAGEDARVHVIAARTALDTRDGRSAALALAASAANPAAGLAPEPWRDNRSAYISGRNLGDELRYIADRRQEPGRIGNMLGKPSMLLNPWSVAETETKETKFSFGDGWSEEMDTHNRNLRSASMISGGGFGGDLVQPGYACRDFLPQPALVFANLRPGADGVVSVDVSAADGMQDIEIVAFDGTATDSRRIVSEPKPFEPRDLRMRADFDALADGGRSKTYRTAAELFSLARSIEPYDSVFAEFAFVADWAAKSPQEKRDLYGKYASHELDLFLYWKDRAFFDSVAAPALRNKGRKDFMDKWLLGEDVSAYAAPGRMQELNALETCLLALRVKSAAPAAARRLADWCAANPPDAAEADRRMAVALDDMGAADGDGARNAPEAETAFDMAAAPESEQPEVQLMRSAPAAAAPRGNANHRIGAKGRSAAVAKKRSVARQFYRPPERTKEWVETYWYRRRGTGAASGLVPPCRFWSEWAAAIAAGRAERPRSPSILEAFSGFTSKMAAIAVADVPLAAPRAGAAPEGIAFARPCGAQAGKPAALDIVQRFVDPSEEMDGGQFKEVAGEFQCGVEYAMETIVMNPVPAGRRIRVVAQIPAGAVPLGSCPATADATLDVGPYASVPLPAQKFYFPSAGEGVGALRPARAIENGVPAGTAARRSCAVVPGPGRQDVSSWRYVSQNAPKGDVLAWLATNSLANADLEDIGWRMVDDHFARRALAALEARGEYCESLWLAGLQWKSSYDPERLRQVLARSGNIAKLARRLGPALDSPMLKIDPEESGVFEHKEYWPVINARAHAKGAAAEIANAGLAAEWRAFTDALAAKSALSARDRLLAAVYLAAQDRIAEAEAQAALAAPQDVNTQMQLDYMKAWFAFSHGRPEEARPLAAKWAEVPSAIWRERFAQVVAQADEISGGADAGGANAAEPPSLALSAGNGGELIVSARNLEECVLKAYPADMEIAFSKDPFGNPASAAGALSGMKPAWTCKLEIGGNGKAAAKLPRELQARNVTVVATGADGRAEDRVELAPGTIAVQVSRETRVLRVRDSSGKPVPGAYVKVYARAAGGGAGSFHKDGYTDIRGAFDYASVSTDSGFRPAEYAVYVQCAGGEKRLKIEN